jgi:HSP20 family protein
VHAELPGVPIDEIGLEIQGRELVIAGTGGRRSPRGASTNSSRSTTGRSGGSSTSGADVEAQEAHASYRDGILRVELPLARPEPRSPRQVPDRRTRRGGGGSGRLRP